MKSGTFDVLKVRDFSLLWSGQTVSSMGDGIFTIALALVTLDVDRHPSGIALVFAARAIPSVALALVGGVVVDRVSRRLVMLTSDSIRGAAVGVTALLLARGQLRLWELIVMAAIFGAADSFFGPASMTIVPELLTADQLVAGNALSQMSNQLTQGLLGPAIGGFIVAAIGTAWSFGIDAMSFLVSALCLFALRSRSRPARSTKSPAADAREGLSYVWTRPYLLYAVIGAALANVFGMAPLTVLLPLFIRETLHASALERGLVYAAGGASGVVASLIVARLGSPRRQITVLWCSYALSGVAVVAIASAPNVLVTGFLAATTIGVRHSILIGGFLSAAICLGVLFVPGVRDPERESPTNASDVA
jgi:DHA3 family tetracycline resistance protein-like MFS transporter